jgi:peroxiredoxin
MTIFRSAILARVLMVAALSLASAVRVAGALVPGDPVGNFQLTDQAGAVHELYGLSSKQAIVVMTQSNGCPIVRLAVPTLRAIRDQYQAKNIEFLLLNPTLQDTAESVRQEVKEFDFGLPVLLDPTQKVAESWGVTRTAEVYVIDPKTWRLVFHGPIDDRLSYETQRPVHHQYLTDALNATIAAKPIAVAAVVSPGCLINFPKRKPHS